jgi:hypothetical protein
MFDVHPVTGRSIEVFYADRTLETFGRGGAGWFWWLRRRRFAPEGSAVGPFPTSYSAYRNALGSREAARRACFGRRNGSNHHSGCKAAATFSAEKKRDNAPADFTELFQLLRWCPGAESNHRHCDFVARRGFLASAIELLAFVVEIGLSLNNPRITVVSGSFA